MSSIYTVGYSKSARSKCHGPAPCTNSSIASGTLRFGLLVQTEWGENVQWRHWGCVTPAILAKISNPATISGFSSLIPEDQTKIRAAVAARRVDPSDIPASAYVPDVPAELSRVSNSQAKKRKAPESSASTSAMPSSSQRSALTQGSSEVIEIDDDDDVEEEVPDELYVTLRSNIVGVQYYMGLVGANEEVVLQREPHNGYDSNAIQVLNINRTQVGHVPKNVASRLAPLMDARAITVEGIMLEGNLIGSRGYTLSMNLKIYGPSDKRQLLEPRLVWATPGQRGFGSRASAPAASSSRSAAPAPPSSSQAGRSNAKPLTPAQQIAAKKQQEALAKAAELRSMLNSLEKVDDEGRRNSLLDQLCSVDDILNLPLHPDPPGISNGKLLVDLLTHQKQGLQWCMAQEHPAVPQTETSKPVQFWQLKMANNKRHYYNLATKTPQSDRPELGRGGIFADAMGLGKTLTMLALIIMTLEEEPNTFSSASLIVVPLSVLSNWEQQIKEHCVPGSLSSHIYYGSNRSASSQELSKFDIVITTYQVVAGEHLDGVKTGAKKKKTDRTLFEVKWKRIILDEAHTIRNPKTKTAKAIFGLDAERRWVLSGTPIINSPRDLGSLLTFLRICRPLDNEDFFKRLLLRPLKDGSPAGAELLRALMSQACIRRTKEMQDSKGNVLVPLPPVEMIVIPVALDEDARSLYDQVEAVSKQRVERFLRGGMGMTTAAHSKVLSMLTRMRQLALHPGLIPPNYLSDLRAADANDAMDGNTPPKMEVTPEQKVKLQDRLAQAIEECEECPICISVPSEPRITSCAHIFCFPCIKEVISRDPREAKCPMDRRTITLNDVHEPVPPSDLTQEPIQRETDPDALRGSSAKIDQLVQLLTLTPSNEKSLVFSQFTTFLDKIAETLDAKGISYVRFDGRMSAKRRQETIAQFSIPLREENGVLAETEEEAPRRARKATRKVVIDDDEDGGQADGDDDFVMDDDYDASSPPRPKAKSKGKAKGKARAKSPPPFDVDLVGGDNPRVMLLSLKAGALGLNLTVANNVYLMDPWWQEGIESQAIDRVNRIGQKKPVHVYQLIAENTVESKVLDIQEKKKKLIKEAFSGIKRTETQREQREARLQELVELFGIRRQAASQTS